MPLCFVISGATSLVLQVVWVRKLVEIFGSSTLAIATVLASFMGGLALGAAIGGRLADRFGVGSGRGKDDPFLYYGLAEAIVGLTALLIPVLITGFRGPNAWLWGHLGDTPVLLALARFALTALILLIPTTAMGATLPLLTRRVTARAGNLDELGRHLGILYAANTLGAVSGAAVAGFALIPKIGAAASGRLAAACALALAALVALYVFFSRARIDRALPGTAPVHRAAAPELSRRVAILAYAVSGGVAMSLEVLFSRALAIVNGSSTTSFTLILIVFLSGISLGAAILGRYADRTPDPIALLGKLLLAAAAAIALTAFLIDDLPKISAALLEGGNLDAGTILTIHAAITAITIAPVAIALGAIMPVAIRAYVGSADRVGRDVGRAYAANTVGAIVGSVATGFLLMPLLTIEFTLRGLVVLDALMAAALFYLAARDADWSRQRRRAIAVLVSAVILAGVFAPRWNRSDFTAGLFRTHIARAAIKAGGIGQRDVIYYRDGTSTTVTVEKLQSGVVVLKNNGKVEASSRVDMPTQILVGLLPVLLRGDDPQDVFVVGYGSGVTVGAIIAAPMVSRLVVAELEPAVYEAADAHFSDINHRPQDDARVERVVGDGRNVLLAGGRKYDVIVSEPSNPWIAGVASLFTREFYKFARDHLAEDGIFCQWAQLYELGPASVKMIYATFAESFPYVYAFTPGDEVTDTILIGSLEPVDLSPNRMRAVIARHPSIAAELDRADVGRPEDLIAAAFLAPGDLPSFTAGAQINTDDSGALEYRAPRDLLNSAQRRSVARMVRSPGWPYGRLEALLPPATSDVAMARALLEYGRRRTGQTFLSRAGPGLEKTKAELLYSLSRPREVADPELLVTSGGGPSLPMIEATLFDVSLTKSEVERATLSLRDGYKLIAAGRWPAAFKKLASLPKRADTHEGRDITFLLAYLAYKSINLSRARDLLASLTRRGDSVVRRPAILYYLGRCQYGVGSFRDGIETLSDFATRYPELASQASVDPFEAPTPPPEPTGDRIDP